MCQAGPCGPTFSRSSLTVDSGVFGTRSREIATWVLLTPLWLWLCMRHRRLSGWCGISMLAPVKGESVYQSLFGAILHSPSHMPLPFEGLPCGYSFLSFSGSQSCCNNFAPRGKALGFVASLICIVRIWHQSITLKLTWSFAVLFAHNVRGFSHTMNDSAVACWYMETAFQWVETEPFVFILQGQCAVSHVMFLAQMAILSRSRPARHFSCL